MLASPVILRLGVHSVHLSAGPMSVLSHFADMLNLPCACCFSAQLAVARGAANGPVHLNTGSVGSIRNSAARLPLAIAGALVLALAAFGALLLSLCLYTTVRPWSRAHYRRMLCAYVAAPLVDAAALLLPRCAHV